MSIKTTVYSPYDLTDSDSIFRQLSHLTMPTGTMLDNLNSAVWTAEDELSDPEAFDPELIEEHKNTVIIVASDGDKIVGWTMLIPAEYKKYNMQIYVDPNQRRQGVGTVLAIRAKREAVRKDRKIECQAWDERSLEFFQACGLDYNIDPYAWYGKTEPKGFKRPQLAITLSKLAKPITVKKYRRKG